MDREQLCNASTIDLIAKLRRAVDSKKQITRLHAKSKTNSLKDEAEHREMLIEAENLKLRSQIRQLQLRQTESAKVLREVGRLMTNPSHDIDIEADPVFKNKAVRKLFRLFQQHAQHTKARKRTITSMKSQIKTLKLRIQIQKAELEASTQNRAREVQEQKDQVLSNI